MKRLGPVVLTVLLDMLGFGLVVPFLADEARSAFGAGAATGALLGAVYSLMQLVFVPVWGRLSDRVGRRPVLLASIAASGLAMAGLGLGLAFGGSVLWLFAARTAGGIATANMATAAAYVADVTTPQERSRGMGLLGAAFGLGFILGPAIGGALAQIPVHGRHGPWACFVAAGLGAANLVWAWIAVKESLPAAPPSRPDARAAARVLRRPEVGAAVAQSFVVVCSFALLDHTFRYFNKDVFGMTELGTGLLLGGIGVLGVVTQGGLLRVVARRFDEAALVRAGVLLQLAAFVGLAVAGALGVLVVAGGVLAIGHGLTQPSLLALVSKRAPAGEQGAALGAQQAAGALGRVIGPALGGCVYGAIGTRAPYVTAAVGMGAAFILATRLGRGRAALRGMLGRDDGPGRTDVPLQAVRRPASV
jgi:MFS family permease